MKETIAENFMSKGHFVRKLFTAKLPKIQLGKWRLKFFICSLAQKKGTETMKVQFTAIF